MSAAVVNWNLSGGLSAALSVGVEVPTSGTFGGLSDANVFVYGSSQFNATFRAVSDDVQAKASVGPLGIFVGSDTQKGWVAISRDGTPTGAAALAHFGFSSPSTRYYGFDTILTDIGFTMQGAAGANLPIFFPTQSNKVNPNLVVQISDLADPIDTFHIVSAPDFSTAINGMDLTGDLDSLISGISNMLQLLENALAARVLSANLPMIGNKLADAAQFVRDLRENLVDAVATSPQKTANAVRDRLWDVLGPSNLNLLRDANGDGLVTPADLGMTADMSQVDFVMHIGDNLAQFDLPFDLDLGVPALGLDVDGKVVAKLGFDFTFGFGVNKTDGVYFNVAAPEDLSVFFEVGLQSLSATGQLLFLQLDVNAMSRGELTPLEKAKSGVDPSAPDTSGAVNGLRGEFTVAITDPNADGKLTLSELASTSPTSIITATLDANASIHLAALASMGGSSSFPSIGAEIHLYWSFGSSTDYDLTTPEIVFSDVRLNLGEFFSNMFGGVLEKVQDVIEPIKPVLDILTADIPIISQLAGPVTFVDLARLFGRGDIADFVEAAADIADLITSIPVIDGDVYINLGGFTVTFDSNGNPTITPDSEADAFDPRSAMAASGAPNAASYYDSMLSLNTASSSLGVGVESLGTEEPDRLQLPILTNPMSIFQLLLGKKDIVLITYDLPAVGMEFEYSQYFPIVGPLGARIGGKLGFNADFAFGFDTQGFFDAYQSGRVGDIFNGFYVSDRANADGTGADVPEASLYGGIEAFGELNLGIASGGVGGGITFTMDFNLHDQNNDGKVRVGEIVENFLLRPDCVFDIVGRLEAGLEAYVKFGISPFAVEATFDIAKVTLLEFTIPRPDPAPDTTPILASVDPSGQLKVHVGEFAALRVHGDLSDGNDQITIRRGNTANDVFVIGFGVQQHYTGVTSILVNSGAGDDAIIIESSVSQPATVHGGEGNDVLSGGSGAVAVYGEAGNDRLTGGSGNDLLDAGDGNNTVYGGYGNDTISAGAGR